MSDTFPYKHLLYPRADMHARFVRLIGYKAKFVANHKFGAMFTIALSASDYEQYNLISDWFIEAERLRARRIDAPSSVIEYWEANCENIMRETRGDKMAARELIYSRTKEVGTFRPTLVLAFVQYMRETLRRTCSSILDPCAGWGDRLIGALAAPGITRYTSVDPNANLAPHYGEIERELGAIAQKKFTRTHFIAGFEQVPSVQLLGDAGPFDLVITSPPFFTLEVYESDNPNQSINAYPKFEDWHRRFLIPSLAKAASMLRRGGIMAINISDVLKYRFTHRLLADVAREAQRIGVALEYVGHVITEENGRASMKTPFFIWSRES